MVDFSWDKTLQEAKIPLSHQSAGALQGRCALSSKCDRPLVILVMGLSRWDLMSCPFPPPTFKELIAFIKHVLPYSSFSLESPASFVFCSVQFGEKEAEGWPRCSLQLPEEQKERKRCWALLPGVRGRKGMVQSCIRGGLDIRKQCFTKRVLKQCSRLPREAIHSPGWSVSKRLLDNALNNSL